VHPTEPEDHPPKHETRNTKHETRSIALDLGRPDEQIAIITPAGWTIDKDTPVYFRRTPFTFEIPIPERGGRLDQLREFIPVTDEGWSLLRGWLVAALFPSIDHPILRLAGAKSTTMTSALRMISSLIDPSKLPVRSKPTNRDNWLASAPGSWCLAIQNVTHIPEWFGEVLNRAITGSGQARRAHHADADTSICESRHVIAMSGVQAGSIPDDLSDAFVVVELTPPDSAGNLPEADLLAKFDELKPQLFGALLDEVSATLGRLPNVKLAGYPRMADFARILAALPNSGVALAIAAASQASSAAKPTSTALSTEEQEQASGNTSGCSTGRAACELPSPPPPDTFGHVADTLNAQNATQDTSDTSDTFSLNVYLRQLEHLAAEETERDPVAKAITEMVQCRGNWQGTATKLLEALARPKSARDWPQSPTAMSLRVTRLAPALRTKGIAVDNARSTDSMRSRNILLTADPSVQTQQA
jgi:hypothetical protein